MGQFSATAVPATRRLDKLDEIESSAIRIRDAVSTIRAIVAAVWENPVEAGPARNALQRGGTQADNEADLLMHLIDEARK